MALIIVMNISFKKCIVNMHSYRYRTVYGILGIYSMSIMDVCDNGLPEFHEKIKRSNDYFY